MIKYSELSVYLTPTNHRYSAVVDKFINDLLNREPQVVSLSAHATLRVKDKYISLWIANKWYAYLSEATDTSQRKGEFAIFGNTIWKDKRPSRKTMLRFSRYLENHQPVDDLTVSKLLGEDLNNGRQQVNN